MTPESFTIAKEFSKVGEDGRNDTKLRCQELGAAINKEANVGETVEKVQQLILQYYTDVRNQGDTSFRSAKNVARFGFVILVVTVAYLIFTDLLAHIEPTWFHIPANPMNVGTIGVISGAVIEMIAGTQFVLHGRTTKQFGAFHICLERTHRYLLAFKIAEQIKEGRDKTLEKIVCIMANAPMITQHDIDGLKTARTSPNLESDSEDAKAKAASGK